MIFQHHSYIHVSNSDNPINWLKQPKVLSSWQKPKAGAGFLLAFWPRGDKMRLYGLLLGGGEGQVCIRVQSMWQTRRVWGHAPPGNLSLDLLLIGTI